MNDRIRKGMWVRLADRVGIVADFPDGAVEVHLTNVDGLTETIVIVGPSLLAQAAVDDIPAARRPVADVAHSLGYF